MSEYMELVYDNYVSEEKLKTGTKYEKLAAIVYKILDQESVVIHNLILRGKGKTASHQIDVTIEKDNRCKRILVECKDYNEIVGIGIIRDFLGAVSQIKPDEAIVITTKGFTREARNFAEDERIKLAILRDFRDDDWDGFIRKVVINGKLIFMGKPKITWIAKDEKEKEKAQMVLKDYCGELHNIDLLNESFYDKNGNIVSSMHEKLQPIFDSLPKKEDEKFEGRYEFDDIYYVNIYSVFIGVRGFYYEYNCYASKMEIVVDEGRKIAILLYKMLDGSDDKVIFNTDLENWTFNGEGKVIPKDDRT